jgi:hypothetical protein
MSKLKSISDKEVAQDIQIAAGATCVGLLSQDGVKSIQQVLQGANDPAKALAHVIYMSLAKVKQMLDQRGIKIDHRIWIMGGGVLDRVIFEVMIVLATALKYEQAGNQEFVHQVKSDTLDLMDDDDQNSESIKTLHAKGLPMPKPPTDDQQGGNPQQQQQGLVAPQEQQQMPQQGAPQ